MRFLHAEFGESGAATEALRALLDSGVGPEQIEVYSRRPLEADPPLLARRSRMSLVAVTAAALTGVGATFLMYRAQMDYPLVTGGMPINSGWATGVVTFEATMAGAVLGILAALLYESGLLRPRKSTPIPEVPPQGAVIQVASRHSLKTVEDTLRRCGARRVERAEDRIAPDS